MATAPVRPSLTTTIPQDDPLPPDLPECVATALHTCQTRLHHTESELIQQHALSTLSPPALASTSHAILAGMQTALAGAFGAAGSGGLRGALVALETRMGCPDLVLPLLQDTLARLAPGGARALLEGLRETVDCLLGALDEGEGGVWVGAIEADVREAERVVEQARRRVEELGVVVDKEKECIMKLERVREELGRGNVEGVRGEVLRLREEGVLHFEHINCSIEEYRAFYRVEKVFNINKVMEQPLLDVGEGIKMSQPVYVELKLKTGNIQTANISHNGVVAICYYDGRCHLQLTNLFTKQQVEFSVEAYTATAFYDDKIVVMTTFQKLREAPVDALFTTPSTDTLQVIGDVGLGDCPPNTLTQQTRRVYYRSSSGDLYEYNVDTKENSKIKTRHRVNSIASSGGIDMAVKCVFRDEDDKKIYALKRDNSVEYVNDGNRYNSLTDVFPSSNTTDLGKALYRMNGKFVYKNQKVDLKCPVGFNGYTIVRLYKDVFLVYDRDEEKWKMLRIVVP